MISINAYFQEQTRGGVDYELRGMVLHHGISAEGGHYTAEVKRGTKWYRIDDNRVSEMKLSEVLHADSRRTPYLLLWARL
jgi:ubiquitin carboxyl-terminal hydrolase 10